MTQGNPEEVLQKSVVRSIRATRGEWEKWGLAAEDGHVNLNAWIRVVLNEASSYVLEQAAKSKDARESRGQLLDAIRGRGPVSKYFDRR